MSLQAPTLTAPDVGRPLVPPHPQLTGRWTRSLLETADGSCDVTTDVTWLQAGELYVDLRLPQPLPEIAAGCLRALSRDEAVALAAVEGFAGAFVADGPWAYWRRPVDLQPTRPTLDQGSLTDVGDRPGDHVVETGRDGSYREHWHRAPGPAHPRAAVLLADPGSGAHAVLVRVGPDVAWARGRPVALTGGTLADRVRAAGALAVAQDLLDAEVSLGRVGRPADRSSLPWRVGSVLGVVLDLPAGLARTADTAPDGSPLVRTWRVLALEGSAADLPSLPLHLFGEHA